MALMKAETDAIKELKIMKEMLGIVNENTKPEKPKKEKSADQKRRDEIAEAKKKIEDLDIAANAFIGSLQNGIRSVGQDINKWIGDSFARSFNEANSLFEKFLVGVLQGLAEIGMQLATLQLLGWMFPSIGFGGFAKGLGGIAGAFAGNKNVAIANGTGQGVRFGGSQGVMGSGAMIARTEIKGADLAIIVEHGNRQRAGRLF